MRSFFQRIFAPALYVLIFFAGFFTAFVWFNPQSYRADLAPTLTAVALVALVWLLYAAVAAKSRARAQLHERQLKIQQESIQPVLHAVIQRLEDKPEMLVLALRNHGKGMAKNIRLRIAGNSGHEAGMAVAAAISQLPVFAAGLDQLAAGETYAGIFADIRALGMDLPNQMFGGTLTLAAEFDNAFDQAGMSESVLDLALLNNGSRSEEGKARPRLLY